MTALAATTWFGTSPLGWVFVPGWSTCPYGKRRFNAAYPVNFLWEPELQNVLILKAAVWAGVTTALLAVFALYTRADFLVTLANQVWACF